MHTTKTIFVLDNQGKKHQVHAHKDGKEAGTNAAKEESTLSHQSVLFSLFVTGHHAQTHVLDGISCKGNIT